MRPRAREQMIQDAFDGGLDEARAAELRMAIRESPESLELYCNQAILESELRHHTAALNRPVLPEEPRRIWTWLASAAAMVLAAVGFWYWMVYLPVHSVARVAVAAGSVVRYPDGTLFKEEKLRSDRMVVIEEGTMKVSLASGAEGEIEGPASVRLLAADRMELRSGRTHCQVPDKAARLRVTTDRFEVTEGGRDFWVDLRRDKYPQIDVTRGEVRLTSLIGERQQVLLHAGDSATLTETGRWGEVHGSPEKGM